MTARQSHSLSSILPWIVIAILAVGTAGWVIWAGYQKGVRSSWTPD